MNFFKQKKNLAFIFFIFCTTIFMYGLSELPVMDRDEARFATASKTMLETNDFIDIKMNDEVRYKKPIGIYWAQVAANLILGEKPFDKIWIYRIPSIIGVVGSIFLIFFYVLRRFDINTAFLSSFFLICSLLSISEIHQAKTDGLLFFFVNLCNLIIFEAIREKKLHFFFKFCFWISLSCSVLIKGPISLIFIFTPLIAISLIYKENFFRYVWIWRGLIIFFFIVLPWFIAITLKSGGVFWHESVIHDLLKKVGTGQESHGFPPGYYTILLFIMFWPGSIFLISFCKKLKNSWRKILKEKDTCFLIFWFLIPFLFYEIIFTKLPHYVFPSYTALSILLSNHLVKNNFNSENLRYSLIPLLIFPIFFVGAFIYVTYTYSNFDNIFIVITVILTLNMIYLLRLRFKEKIKKIIIFSGTFQLLVYLICINFFVPRLNSLWISQNIVQIIDDNIQNVDEVLNFGFNEPSLVFLSSHKSRKTNPSSLDRSWLEKKKILFVITEEYSDIFEKDEKFLKFKLINKFNGFNYSQGKNVEFKIFIN